MPLIHGYMSICLWVALCNKACISVTSNVFIVCLVEILDMILYSNQLCISDTSTCEQFIMLFLCMFISVESQ